MKTAKNSAGNPGTVDLDAAKKAAALLESEYGAKAPAQPGVGFGIDNPAVYLPAVLIPVLAGIGAVIYRKRRTA